MAAPTFIQEAETAWNSTTTPKGSGNFTTSTSDVVVACSVREGNSGSATLSATGTNVSLTSQQEVAVLDYTGVEISAGVVASGGTTSVSFANAAADWFGGNALTFRGSDGIGASAKTNTTGAPSLNITTTQDNSAIVVVVGDWNAADGASRTWRTVNSITPTSGNGYELTYFRDASHYTLYVAYYPDAGAAGSKTVGLSAPSGQKYAIVALEVKGAAGSSPKTATTSLSAAIQQALAATASVGAAVQTSGSATAGVSTAVQIGFTGVASADAAVQAARTATAAADAAVQALQSASASVTAYIQAGGQVSASLGAAVQAASTATASIGAAIQAGRTATASLGAALQASGTASSTLGAAVQAALTATASLGAALQAARTATVGVTAYVQAGSVVVAQLDAAIQAARTAAASVDAAIQQARSATASLSAAIATTRTVTTGLAAAIAAPLSLSASIQAAVRAALSTSATLGAYVSDPTIPVFSAPSRLRIGAVGEAVDAVRLGPSTAKPAARIGSADE